MTWGHRWPPWPFFQTTSPVCPGWNLMLTKTVSFGVDVWKLSRGVCSAVLRNCWEPWRLWTVISKLLFSTWPLFICASLGLSHHLSCFKFPFYFSFSVCRLFSSLLTSPALREDGVPLVQSQVVSPITSPWPDIYHHYASSIPSTPTPSNFWQTNLLLLYFDLYPTSLKMDITTCFTKEKKNSK